MLILSYTETGSHVTYTNGQLLSARFQRDATFIGANFSLGHQMHSNEAMHINDPRTPHARPTGLLA